MRKSMRTLASCIFLLATLPFATASQAQHSPRAIQLVVNAPAGGSVDAVARLFAEKAGGAFKGRVVVVNKPGAGGVLGEGMVARAEPDGTTILFAGSTIAVNSAIYQKPPYDAAAIQPVALLASLPFAVMTNPEVPVKNLAEMIQLAKKTPQGLAAASAAGSILLATHLMQRAGGVQFQIVPYNGGPPAALALMRNDVQLAIADVGSMAPHIRSGKLRALAVTGKERAMMLPEVPTTAEAGLADFQLETWFGVFSPRGVSTEFLGQLNAEVNRFLRDPEVVAKLQGMGGRPGQMSLSDFETYYEDARSLFKRVIKESGIPLQ